MSTVIEKTPGNKQETETNTTRIGGSKGYCFVKRVFDLIASLVGLIVLALPMLIIALIIRLDSPGPAFFIQDRMGQHGNVFKLYKFRTMRLDAPSDIATKELGNVDVYLTTIGRFLRKTSLDELPQLLNILVGEMSFVGYRPVCLSETELNALRKEYGVFKVKPGLTGLAQVQGRDNISFTEKAKIDAEYVRNCGIKMDLLCLIKTVRVVISGEGVI